MKNRVRQFRTLGSVRGGDGAATVHLNGHAAGNGGHGQGKPTAATGPLLLGGIVLDDPPEGIRPLHAKLLRRDLNHPCSCAV